MQVSAQRAHEKETAGEPRRQGQGNIRVDTGAGQWPNRVTKSTTGRNHGGTLMPKPASNARDTKSVTPVTHTKFVRHDGNNLSPSRKRRFAVILGGLSRPDGTPLTNKEIALVAGCSEVTVKAWKAERELPNLKHVFDLASTFETVAGWMNDEVELGRVTTPDRLLTASIFALQQSAGQPTHEGAMARALLKEIMRGRSA